MKVAVLGAFTDVGPETLKVAKEPADTVNEAVPVIPETVAVTIQEPIVLEV